MGTPCPSPDESSYHATDKMLAIEQPTADEQESDWAEYAWDLQVAMNRLGWTNETWCSDSDKMMG